MDAPPAGISGADWLATPVAVRALILAEQEEIEQLRVQLTALATELASLRERIGRSSRNSSKSLQKKPAHKLVFPMHELISGSKRRSGDCQIHKQLNFGIVGMPVRHWLRPFGHSSGQWAVHAASITSLSRLPRRIRL